jgi:cytochrome c-type biogenesis protein
VILASANTSLIGAFAAGLYSFVSPCVLPLVPGYLSLMTGVSVAELRQGPPTRRVIVPTFLFIGGFTVVFVALGAAATSLGTYLLEHRVLFDRLSGAVVILFGVFLFAGMVLHLPFLFQEARFHPAVADMGELAAPIMGAAFAFGWTPCIGPVLGAVLTAAATQGTVGRGMALLAAYSLGLGVPFLITSLALGKLTGVLGWFSRNGRWVTGVSASALVAFGALLFFGQLTVISGWLLRLFDKVPGLRALTRI